VAYASATHILRPTLVIVSGQRIFSMSLGFATTRTIDLRKSFIMKNVIDEGQAIAREK
jgi:hypothetical protein